MMFKATTPKVPLPIVDISSTSEFILSVQRPDGEIPWSKGGQTDPWDHVESAMGITVGGYYQEAKKAYTWLSNTQLPDGSWWSYYNGGKPVDGAYKDSNMTAYIAVGVLHYYLSTGDIRFVKQIWPTVCRAMDYVTELQDATGIIFWAKRADGSVDRQALLTGSSSIYKSLRCALHLAALLGEQRDTWENAAKKLGHAIRFKPHVFDQSKSRYAMDWYYPILSGAMKNRRAVDRIDRLWNRFAIPGWGVRCVSDKPWATMAETAELAITLAAMGKFEVAEFVLEWILDKKYDDGAYWTGVTYPDRTIYTIEKTTWTAAAVLLATDIIYSLSPASHLFSHGFKKSIQDRPSLVVHER